MFFHQIVTPTQLVFFPCKSFIAYDWPRFGNFVSSNQVFRLPLLWDITWHLLEDGYQWFGTACWSHLGRLPGISNHQPMLHNIPEQQRPQLHCGRSLKDPSYATMILLAHFPSYKIGSIWYHDSVCVGVTPFNIGYKWLTVMRFGINVMPLETTLTPSTVISFIYCNTSMADAETCKVGMKMSLNAWSQNVVR